MKTKCLFNMAKLIVLLSIVACASAHYSASKLVKNIYNECLSQYSVECVKPRALQWISLVANDDEIKITDNLSVVRTAVLEDEDVNPRLAKDPIYSIFDKVDGFLQTHSVKVKVPEEVTNSAAAEYVPRSLLTDLPSELDMPLDGEEEVEEGRKKKFKLPKPLKIKSSTL